jgi:hypothetical protein
MPSVLHRRLQPGDGPSAVEAGWLEKIERNASGVRERFKVAARQKPPPCQHGAWKEHGPAPCNCDAIVEHHRKQDTRRDREIHHCGNRAPQPG